MGACLWAVAPGEAALIGYWDFNDQAGVTADLSAGGNPGTLNGGASYVAGHTGGGGDFAVDFEGTNSSVTTGASIMSGLSQFTTSGWVQIDSFGVRIGLWGQNDAWEFGLSTNGASGIEGWTPTVGTISSLPNTLAADGITWTHIAMVGDGAERRLYFNGAQVGSQVFPAANYGISGFGFNIGGGGIWDAAGNWFNGRIDDVAVWDDALTPDQIVSLASGGSPLVIPEPARALLLGLGVFAALGLRRRRRDVR